MVPYIMFNYNCIFYMWSGFLATSLGKHFSKRDFRGHIAIVHPPSSSFFSSRYYIYGLFPPLWQIGGFQSGIIALAAMTVAYMAVIFCLAELTSAIPFSGGSKYIYTYMHLHRKKDRGGEGGRSRNITGRDQRHGDSVFSPPRPPDMEFFADLVCCVGCGLFSSSLSQLMDSSG